MSNFNLYAINCQGEILPCSKKVTLQNKHELVSKELNISHVGTFKECKQFQENPEILSITNKLIDAIFKTDFSNTNITNNRTNTFSRIS